MWCGVTLTDNNTTQQKLFYVDLDCWLGCGNKEIHINLFVPPTHIQYLFQDKDSSILLFLQVSHSSTYPAKL